MPRLLVTLLAAVLTALSLVATSAPAHAGVTEGIEDYAGWQPQTRCAPKAKPGTVALGRWVVAEEGGGFGGISRACKVGGTSEHKEGRAFDWTLDAAKRADRRRAARFLKHVRQTDKAGNTDAVARRMGIMYIIWNDRMYAAWDEFAPEPYLSSSCKSRRKCSKSLRHRDHMHISLSRAGGKGRTSWYDGRVG